MILRLPHWRRFSACLFVLAVMAACANQNKPLGGYEFSDHDVPDESAAIGNRRDITPITVLPTEADYYRLTVSEPSDPVPDVKVGPLVADGVPLLGLLDLLTSEHGIALSVDQSIDGRVVRLRDPGVRPLKDMLNEIAENAGVFYIYHGGVLRIVPQVSFNITVPRVADNVATVAGTLGSLGATSVQVDVRSSIISFKADRNAINAINPYLQKSREATDLIIFDTWFLEVTLDNEHQLGVNWNQLSLSNTRGGLSLSNQQTPYITDATGNPIGGTAATVGGAAASTIAAGGANAFSLGLAAVSGAGTISALINFLDTQGVTRSLAKPTMTLISGGKSSFKIGEAQQYISGVTGATTTNNTTTAGGITTTELDTGINIQLSAAYNDGTIVADVNIEQDTLLGFQTFSSGTGSGTESLQLPDTQKRSLLTSVQSRPGDLVVIAGMLQDDSTDNQARLPVADINTSRSQSVKKVELVFLMRPRIVQFRPRLTRLHGSEQPAVPGDPAPPVFLNNLSEGEAASHQEAR